MKESPLKAFLWSPDIQNLLDVHPYEIVITRPEVRRVKQRRIDLGKKANLGAGKVGSKPSNSRSDYDHSIEALKRWVEGKSAWRGFKKPNRKKIMFREAQFSFQSFNDRDSMVIAIHQKRKFTDLSFFLVCSCPSFCWTRLLNYSPSFPLIQPWGKLSICRAGRPRWQIECNGREVQSVFYLGKTKTTSLMCRRLVQRIPSGI
jgi:hypothetical protein